MSSRLPPLQRTQALPTPRRSDLVGLALLPELHTALAHRLFHAVPDGIVPAGEPKPALDKGQASKLFSKVAQLVGFLKVSRTAFSLRVIARIHKQ